MANIIRPSFSFKNLPIYRVKSVGKETKNASVPHSLDFTRQASTVEEAPLDGGKYVRYNESWFNILAQLNAIDTLDQYLMKSEEDKGTSAVSNHETTYNHSNFVLSETLENYLLINSEDKGSEAVNSHELEYDHTSFLTSADISNVITEDNIEDFLPDVGISIEDFNPSQFKLSNDLITIKDEVLGGGGISINDFNSTQFELNSSDKVTLKDEIIPTDVSDLDDNTNLIPPHLFFDDTYFSGAGTEVDPKSLRTENLPSGGSKRVATWVAEDNETKKVIFDYWDNNDPIEMIDGLHLIFIIKYNTLDGNYNDTSNRCYLRWTENHTFQRIDNAGTSSDIQSLLGDLGEKLTTIEIRVLNKKVFARVVEGINDKAQTVREFRSQQDFTTLTGMSINQRSRITFKAGNTIILYEL